MKKIKEVSKRYLIGFVIGIVVWGGMSAIAMTYFPSNQTTYDNSVSGLKSKGVQGAIDELYKTCTAKTVNIGGIEVPLEDDGDGLCEDEKV